MKVSEADISKAIRTLTEAQVLQFKAPEISGSVAVATLEVRICEDDETDERFFNLVLTDDVLVPHGIPKQDQKFFSKI